MMHSNYRTSTTVSADGRMHRRFGLTDPAAIEAYVNRRVNDPSLLSNGQGPRYADFFTALAD